MKHSLRRAAIIFSFTCTLLTPCAHAITGQPGTLDSTWSGAGKVITPIGSGDDSANAMTLQTDGKVLLAGACLNGANVAFCAARYLANGTLDIAWNGTGKVITPIGGGEDTATAMTLQPDGKLLLAGSCVNGSQYDFCAVRYLANGTLDSTWNGSGTVITPIGIGDDAATAMTLQPDGKVLLAGTCSNGTNNDFCAVRYLPNGALDSTWNGTGSVITPIGIGDDAATVMTLQPDGKVLVAGYCLNGTTYNFCAARYSANGTLDNAWNGTGKVINSIGSSDGLARTMTLQPDGKVLLAGYCVNGGNADFCVARYLTNGSLDFTWNGTGNAITPIGSSGDYAYAMALQPDAKVLLAGNCYNGINNDFCVARYDSGPFLSPVCNLDIDGDGQILGTVDSLIHARIALGLTGNAVTNGIVFPAAAKRTSWAAIRTHLNTWCGMSLVP